MSSCSREIGGMGRSSIWKASESSGELSKSHWGVRLAASSYFAPRDDKSHQSTPQLFNDKALASLLGNHPTSESCDSYDSYPPLILASILHPRGWSLARTWGKIVKCIQNRILGSIQSSFQYVSSPTCHSENASKTLMSHPFLDLPACWNTLAFDHSHHQPLKPSGEAATSVVSNVVGKSQGKGHFLPPTCDLDEKPRGNHVGLSNRDITRTKKTLRT